MLQSYKSGVKYIKLSEFDTNGIDRGYKIQNAQSLTLLTPEGVSTTYDILSKSKRKGYYLIEIDQNTFNDNDVIGLKSNYTVYNYDFKIKRDKLIYNPTLLTSSITPNPGQFNNVFGNSIQKGGGLYVDYPIDIVKDKNGPNDAPYWNLLSVYQIQETSPLPLEITASIKIDNPYKYEGELALFKLPYNNYKKGTIPQVYNKDNLISSYVTSFKEWENNFDQSSNYNRYYTTSSFKFTTGKNIGPRIYTLTGVVDLLKDETIGLGLMVKEAPTGSAWDNGNSLILESASLEIYTYNKDNTNSSFRSSNTSSSPSTFDVIFNPDWSNRTDEGFGNISPLDIYNFSDWNPMVNNAEGLIPNDKFYIVERNGMYSGSTPVPENIDLITYKDAAGNVVIIAEPSTVSNFNYEQIGARNARYDGSKYFSAGFNLKAKNGLGSSPAEQRTNIFLNCLGAGGQTPEVKDATAFFFNTVIDDKLNIYPSTETDIPQFIDIQDAYAPGLNANVNITPANSNFIAYDGLSGVHKILGLGKVQTLFNTGQGISPWDYINVAKFEGQDVENFSAFWQKKNFQNTDATLNAENGVLRAYKDSPWVRKEIDTGNLSSLNYLDAIGVEEVSFTTNDWQTIPFPDQVIAPSGEGSSEPGYVFTENKFYKFDFNPLDEQDGDSPTIQFEAKIPILWLLHPTYRTGNGSQQNDGDWNPPNNSDGDVLTGDNNNAYFISAFNVQLEYRVRIQNASDGGFANVPIQNYPVNNDYVQKITVSKGIPGCSGGSSNNNFDEGVYHSPDVTPVILRTQPRTYKNGDKLFIQVRKLDTININVDADINLINGNAASRLIKLIKVRNLRLDYAPDNTNNNNWDNFIEDFQDEGNLFNNEAQATLNFSEDYYFKGLYQDPPPIDLVNIPDGTESSEEGWVSLVENLGDLNHMEESGLSLVAFSTVLTEKMLFNSNTGDTQILSSSQTSFSVGDGNVTGYSPENIIPFYVEPGDQIRFGYDENLTRTVTKVYLPQYPYGPLNDFETTRIYLQLDQPFEVPLTNNQVNHFIIRRFNKDNSQLTMEVKKIATPPNSPSGETILSTITPQFPSEALSKEFSLIVRNLSDEGIL